MAIITDYILQPCCGATHTGVGQRDFLRGGQSAHEVVRLVHNEDIALQPDATGRPGGGLQNALVGHHNELRRGFGQKVALGTVKATQR